LKKIEKKSGSKRWTRVPTIKTIGTYMPASEIKKREKGKIRKKERIKIAYGFPREVLSFKGGSYFKREKVELGLATKYHICTYAPYSIHTHILI